MIALLLAFLPPSQDSAPAGRPASSPAAEWPALSYKDKEAAQEAIFNLKRAKVEERVKAMGEKLRTLGRAVVPMLLEGLRKTEGDARARIESLLEELTGPGDASLLARHFGERDPVPRVWVVRRCASFGDRSIVPMFEKLLADPDAEVAFAAALGCCRGGSFAAFDALKKVADRDWLARGKAVREALAGLRGPEAVERLRPALKSDNPAEQTAALRLLSGAGPPGAVPLVTSFLDSTDLRLKLEAVNALRGMLDDAAPLDRPSSFDLIEEVNRWKARLSRR
ncbi:MAG TPA: HEAT repeat domain-containing protein [Planctomycetota bacterium]|nr:HEAT repeat domain-containing protein [Planctomycetota bacterium]